MKRRARRSGFTLIEVAVAMAILGVGIVTCLEIFAGSLRLQGRSTRESQAVVHARVAMDSLLTSFDPKDAEYTVGGYHVVQHARPCTAEEECDEAHFGEDADPEEYPLYLQVDVTWEDGTGKKTYTLRTLRMRPPLV